MKVQRYIKPMVPAAKASPAVIAERVFPANIRAMYPNNFDRMIDKTIALDLGGRGRFYSPYLANLFFKVSEEAFISAARKASLPVLNVDLLEGTDYNKIGSSEPFVRMTYMLPECGIEKIMIGLDELGNVHTISFEGARKEEALVSFDPGLTSAVGFSYIDLACHGTAHVIARKMKYDFISVGGFTLQHRAESILREIVSHPVVFHLMEKAFGMDGASKRHFSGMLDLQSKDFAHEVNISECEAQFTSKQDYRWNILIPSALRLAESLAWLPSETRPRIEEYAGKKIVPYIERVSAIIAPYVAAFRDKVFLSEYTPLRISPLLEDIYAVFDVEVRDHKSRLRLPPGSQN